MKILFIIPEEFEGDHWGGVTTYTMELARELRRQGHTIYLLTPGAKNESLLRYGIRVYKTTHIQSTSVISRFLMKIARCISEDVLERCLWAQDVLRFIKSNKALDVIEAPEWGSSTLFLSPRRSIKARVIVRLHKSWMLYKADNKLPITVHDRVLDLLECWSIVTASGVTSPTKFMIAQYPFLMWILKIKKTPVSMIPYGLTLPKLYKNSYKYSFEPYMLSVGRIEVAKGCVLACSSFISIHRRHKNINLVFIGEDTKMYIEGKWTSCITYIRNMLPKSAQDRVHFIDKQTREKLKKYYQNCLFYIVPSFGHENPSIALLEALSFGKSAIGSNVGGIPEVLDHNKNGLIFLEGKCEDLKDKMEHMLSNSALRRRFEQNALLKRYAYNVQITAKQTLKAYLAI